MRFAFVAATLFTAASVPAWAQPSLDDPICSGPSASLRCQWQLRPDSGEWLPLLAPPGTTINGTSNADALAASGEGDVVNGLGGSDALSSGFNRTALNGGRGNDVLTTDAASSGDGVPAIVVQLGGAGRDAHASSLLATGIEAIHEQLFDLGTGDDEVEATLSLDLSSNSGKGDEITVSNQVFARDGEDAVDVVADAQGFFGESLALNAVDGGDDDDHITVRAISEFSGSGAITENRVNGGEGDDVIDATAINWPNDPDFASNALVGDDGDDVIRAFMLTDSNSSFSEGANEVWGGDGEDELEAIHQTDGENFVTELTTVLDGGKHDDRLRAESRAWGENVITLHELFGRAGNDELRLVLDLLLFDGDDGNESTNVLEGGSGNDHLEASVTADFAQPCDPENDDPPCDWTPRAQNHLAGGSSNDVLVASLAAEVIGASFLNGDGGNDELTVSGGSGNELDGGKGNDSLFVGDGDERLTGGPGRDTSYFDLSADQGSDTLADFETLRDELRFAGIEDQGAPGLIDDLDAVSTFTDLGPANDVAIDLTIGSQIVFAGRGTGAVDSWADLVPASALGLWDGPQTSLVQRVAAKRAIDVPELALLPRDH